MSDPGIKITIDVDMKPLVVALTQGRAAVQEHTDDMAKQFKKLAKESKSAIDDLEKAAKLTGVEISGEMKSVLDQVPKLASGLADVFSGGGIGAFVGVLLQAGIALKGLYDSVIALKGAKEEWAELDKRFVAAEDSLHAKMRQDIIEHIRLTQGGAAAAAAAIKMADKELVPLGKDIEQILSAKNAKELSEGFKKDLEGLQHVTFGELPQKIHDIEAAIGRAKESTQKLNNKFLEVMQYSPLFGNLANAVAGYFGAAAEKGEGETRQLQHQLDEYSDALKEHELDMANRERQRKELQAAEYRQWQQKQMQDLKSSLQDQKDAYDAFHTMSKQDEVKYWNDIIAAHKVKGQNLKEAEQLRWEAQKDVDRKALEDEVAAVQKSVAAAEAGSRDRIEILNDEIAQMEAHHQDQTIEYKQLVDERDRAVKDAAKKELKDEVEKVQEQVKATRAGSEERIKILHDEIKKLESEKKTSTQEYKRLVEEEAQAERDLTKAIEEAYQERRRSAQQSAQAESALAQSRLDFRRQIGKLSESAYEDQMRQEIDATFRRAHKELEIERDHYKQNTKEFEKAAAEVKKLEQKHTADIEKLEQKSFLRRRQQFDQYFKQISGSFNSALNGWMQGTESASQAFGKMFQDIMGQLISFVEQWIEKKIEMWLMDKIIATTGNQAEADTKVATNVSQIESDAFVAAADAYAFWAWDPIAAMEAASEAYSAVSSMAIGAGAVGKFELGGIVPQTGLALVHKGETILPESMSGKGFGAGFGGGNSVYVHMNINAIDSASFKDTVGKHGHMIGELVTKALKKKGIK